jgi:hypothetical protein
MNTTVILDPTITSGSHNLVAYGTQSDTALRTPITIVGGDVFTPLTPRRILDTRTGIGAPAGRVGRLDGSGMAVELQVTGLAGVPATGVSAVALNITVVDGDTNDFGGYVTAYPCHLTRPDVSNLNFVAGQTVPNSVITPVSPTGTVCLYVYGSAHMLADVSGYFTDGFQPVAPERILDTRSGTGGRQGRVGALDGRGTPIEVQVTGRAGIPSSGALAVALNVTVVDGDTNDFGGYVTVYPCGTLPGSSNLNFVTGQTVPNSVIAPLSASGTVCLYVFGTAHLLVDVSGYLTSGITPMSPTRFLDSRTGFGTWQRRVGALDGTGQVLELLVAGDYGVPSNAKAVAMNVTVVDGLANDFGGYVTVYPCDVPRPDSSNLNFTSGQTVPNLVIAPVSSSGKVCFYVYGTAYLVADVSGHM